MPSTATSSPRRLIVLGSTGSIGVNTLAVVENLCAIGAMQFEVVGLAGGSNAALLAEQAQKFKVRHVALADNDGQSALQSVSNVYAGADAALQLIDAVARPGDMVVGAMVGAAGIPATIAAIERGCDIALANKETLVAAGALVMPLARKHGVNIIPIDSEHSAIFQCLEASRHQGIKASREGIEASRNRGIEGSRDQGVRPLDASMPRCLDASVSRIIITASGGPFRTWSKQRIDNATVDEALNHPTWNMGPKVTIDSATMMNKALEIIEAHWLFGLPAEKIEAIVHPQSIVHGLVEFVDGSVMAQMGPPDMRTPIQFALTWPERQAGISRTIEWSALRRMDFEPVDHERFSAPALAYDVILAGGSAGAILNAANEEAVAAFLDSRISFGRIVELVCQTLREIEPTPVHTMDDVLAADKKARAFVRRAAASPPATARQDAAARSHDHGSSIINRKS